MLEMQVTIFETGNSYIKSKQKNENNLGHHLNNILVK